MTSEVDARCLETFPNWLRSLGQDAEAMVDALNAGETPKAARRSLAAGLNYVFKSVDLIPDGIDDIGYLDDAFVLRIAAAHAGVNGVDLGANPALQTLAGDVELVKAFLGDDYHRLDVYVQGLKRSAARGRSVDDIISGAPVRAEFTADVKGFARSYAAPSFGREEKNLIKLRAFFDAKLPR
ncbi:MAG: DUF1232 domain-containing protein [Deltaproteobacteria bacterium]|nr:DUF1232 domain-containing protein [Deltaproteobacteria bacterium]